MDRRDFIRLSVLGAAGSTLLSASVLAETTTIGAGGIYFTKEAPGRWKGKESTHLPNVEIIKNTDSVTVNVVTAHEMKEFEHYIVKHVVKLGTI